MEIQHGPFHEFTDGARAVLHYVETPDGLPEVQGVTLEKHGLVLFDSRRDTTKMLRVFRLTREWALEDRPSPNAILTVS